MKRKLISVLLVSVSVLLTACAGKSEGKSYGDEITNDTLRICVDCSATSSQYSSDPSAKEAKVKLFFENLAEDIKSACNIEQVVFEILPIEGAERKTVLQRLRTEIMAGSGPDVFIMNGASGSFEFGYDNALFNFPEKNMETGLFLPLDEHMENNTQFTDWSNQTKAVMDAGRSDEGQVIIPMTYTFPIWVYPRNKIDSSISDMTMWEILENPETAELGAVLYSSMDRTDDSGNRLYRQDLPFILGKLADYKTEELLFTEDELYKVIETGISLQDEIEKNKLQYIKSNASYDLVYQINLAYFDTEMTLVPTYSMDGGVTASITSYAAVNRNTRFPEAAFSVIDYIMQEEMQRKSDLYNEYFLDGLPMQNDLGQKGKSLYATSDPERVLDEPYFEDLLKIKEQIADVNFQGELNYIIMQLMRDINVEGSVSREDVSEAYKKMKRMMGE